MATVPQQASADTQGLEGAAVLSPDSQNPSGNPASCLPAAAYPRNTEETPQCQSAGGQHPAHLAVAVRHSGLLCQMYVPQILWLHQTSSVSQLWSLNAEVAQLWQAEEEWMPLAGCLLQQHWLAWHMRLGLLGSHKALVEHTGTDQAGSHGTGLRQMPPGLVAAHAWHLVDLALGLLGVALQGLCICLGTSVWHTERHQGLVQGTRPATLT
ncbi:MAG: hypothetical protein FRX49_02040 [Trebouxia sp. A1-2]|nr:MAG: hypothetical protein FRX49_02040 [Trebouxia sp. A1-2]